MAFRWATKCLERRTTRVLTPVITSERCQPCAVEEDNEELSELKPEIAKRAEEVLRLRWRGDATTVRKEDLVRAHEGDFMRPQVPCVMCSLRKSETKCHAS